jgi:hypothetical protein
MTIARLTYGIKLNLSYALHCDFIIYFDLLLLWFGIYLHLVTGTKI